MAKSYYNVLETLVNICTVQDGKIQILLKRKMTDPYKGYWILPGRILSSEETLDTSAGKVVVEITGLPSMYLKQGKTFSNLDRDPDARIIACTFIALTSKNLVSLKKDIDDREIDWFNIDELPKMGYDHEMIIKENVLKLKKEIINNEEGILSKLFPSDFTLPELQSFFENILGKSLDRRNFRKKIITGGYVIDTGQKTTGGAGRPGGLYKFSNRIKEGGFLE